MTRVPSRRKAVLPSDAIQGSSQAADESQSCPGRQPLKRMWHKQTRSNCAQSRALASRRQQSTCSRLTVKSLFLSVTTLFVIFLFANKSIQQQSLDSSVDILIPAPPTLPPIEQRPNVRVNIREWTRMISDDISLVSNRTSCLLDIKRFFEREASPEQFDPAKAIERILNQTNLLLAQHRAAVNAIVAEAEKAAIAHAFVKTLRINYTDVHRVRNELEPASLSLQQLQDQSSAIQDTSSGQQWYGSGGGAQFTSISGGTPVPGPPEWQTPFKSINMYVNKNFGDIPVNTSMSAVHIPLPIYPGSPEVMNGIAWTERLDSVFKHNLAQYMHVHHQYYGDHLGFLRTFPAHKWRMAKSDPDLFDARMRPWYIAGASMPKDVVILIDSSGSMTGFRREIAKGVLFEILDTLTNNDYFSVMRFSETVTPIGMPKCNSVQLRQPRFTTQLMEQCGQHRAMDLAEKVECEAFRRNWAERGQYLRDNPNVELGVNGSYLTDEAYLSSIGNITEDVRDAYLLPATSRNVRYLKSNFTLPTTGIANFTRALMSAFELLQAYERTSDQGAQCNRAIMIITDGAIKPSDDVFNRYNYPNAPVRVFTYQIGREIGDISHTKHMACRNRGYYTHVINLSEVREQVQKYLPVLARPLVLAHNHPVTWTNAYGDETYQVLTDWVLETKRRERARIMLNEERERLNEAANSSDVINIELTNISEYDEIPSVDEQLKNRIICEDPTDDSAAMNQSLHDEIDPLGYNELTCHWTSRRADLLASVVRPVFDLRNTSIVFERVLSKNVWQERETYLRNAQLLGVAAVDLRVSDIIKAAPSYLLGPNGYAILIGQNGFLMHHPDYRALLEDPFDKQSKILKPYFSAVDLTHIEQVYHKSEADSKRKQADENKLVKLREAAVRRATGSESMYVKRTVDCRRRPHIRLQTFYYGPIKDTPFSFMLALPKNYGLDRLSAKLPLDRNTHTYLSPSAYDLWTIHPEYRYCERIGRSPPPTTSSGSSEANQNESLLTLIELVRLAANRSTIGSDIADEIDYDDLSAISGFSSQHQENSRAGRNRQQQQHLSSGKRYICDEELFPSLLFDAKATYESPDSACNALDESRSKIAEIYGLEMAFLATRSGLTRTRVFELSPRTKKLAELFVQRHNRAVDESWYKRTIDWNMRFNENAAIVSVPYNAYVRLIAKLRQRITQRHPAINDTRANCDPLLGSDDEEELQQQNTAPKNDDSSSTLSPLVGGNINEPPASDSMQNDEPKTAESSSPQPALEQPELSYQDSRINYNDYSSFDFLDLIANSSVHVAVTQSIVINTQGSASRQRSPAAVAGQLYDYATFARRFLNMTSLSIETQPTGTQDNSYQQAASAPQQSLPSKIDICPSGSCPTRCGLRNDTIDCLLVDNNGYIVVGEELPHVGRSLVDYDEKLMLSLVERRVFHQINVTDYQAICARANNDQVDVRGGPVVSQASAAAAAAASQQPSSSAQATAHLGNPIQFEVGQVLLRNFASALVWLVSTFSSTLLLRSATPDDLFASETLLGQLYHWQRSPILADAQSAVANQSLLALLPNKTFLRPCEKTITLYETRPVDPSKLSNNTPEFYISKCGCLGWYVYEAIPQTNLLMLIVNTTGTCRKCELPVGPAPQIVLAPTQLDSSLGVAGGPNLAPSRNGATFGSNWFVQVNKTAEDMVCTMLERDAQLYTQRPTGSCLAAHLDERQIHICGRASKLAAANLALIVCSTSLVGLLFVLLSGRWLSSAKKHTSKLHEI